MSKISFYVFLSKTGLYVKNPLFGPETVQKASKKRR